MFAPAVPSPTIGVSNKELRSLQSELEAMTEKYAKQRALHDRMNKSNAADHSIMIDDLETQLARVTEKGGAAIRETTELKLVNQKLSERSKAQSLVSEKNEEGLYVKLSALEVKLKDANVEKEALRKRYQLLEKQNAALRSRDCTR